MSIGKDENVLVHGIHIETGVVFHDLEIKGCEKVRTPQGTARMTTLHRMHHSNNIPPYLA
jgi:hypothetical protein